MLITPDFVYLHYPKAAGTWCHEVLTKAYGERAETFMTHILFDGGIKPRMTMHGTALQRPNEQRSKPVVASKRHPYSLYSSLFRFGVWKERWIFPNDFPERWPHFPNLTQTEFLDYAQYVSDDRMRRVHGASGGLGWLTYRYWMFFTDNPFQALSGESKPDWVDVRWLRHESLEADMSDLLAEHGLTMPSVPPRNATPGDVEWTDDDKRRMREREGWLFDRWGYEE